MLTIILPRGPSLMDTHRFPLYPIATVQTHGFEEKYKQQIAAQDIVIQEDITRLKPRFRKGHHSQFTPRGKLSWLEATIPQMNRWLLERYQNALDALRAAA